MQPFDHWNTWRGIASQSFGFSFATVNPDGTPHVTPIGSLILSKDEPKGLYFQIFTSQMTQNLEHNNRVCILAVNSSKWFFYDRFFLENSKRLQEYDCQELLEKNGSQLRMRFNL
ncbi:pyridoxamine 5'-phosphate oxidase family protein [Peribacillus simplex]|uniref:pyridoxamine 5'-phosphate oxidase family protein n=1 Tax=Peribacillus simplex TaxID=1478 RepID=UPI00203D4919|nr:pyridoxamine 5'-phosphate oxidase family protein [Peribacillus simplex]MCM3677434.1 pyridoxamine 5'-phosphate oxidase family protein [Peribacillus simplex]